MRFESASLLFLLVLGCGDNTTPPARTGYSGTGAALTCLPNLDGVITSAELGAAFGVSVSFLVSPEGVQRTILPTGTIQSDGTRLFDWGEDQVEDQVLSISPGRHRFAGVPLRSPFARVSLGAG